MSNPLNSRLGPLAWWQVDLAAWSANPAVVWTIAVVALLLLVATWSLARRRRGTGERPRGAILCAAVSIALHVLLIWLCPPLLRPGGPGKGTEARDVRPATAVAMATLVDAELSDAAAQGAPQETSVLAPPLPLPSPQIAAPPPRSDEVPPDKAVEAPHNLPDPQLPASLQDDPSLDTATPLGEIDALLSDLWVPDGQRAGEESAAPADTAPPPASETAVETPVETPVQRREPAAPMPAGSPGRVLGAAPADFSNRTGAARSVALRSTGGDDQTEAAVEAGLQWLSQCQRADGAWDPVRSGAGVERSPLGHRRVGAGTRCTTALTGLALMAMLGAGNTHQQGAHAESVRRGLQYLISIQAPDGSLFGDATAYERTYAHGMAALALCEAAAMTGDPAALAAAQAAVGYTVRLQHPVTGGWRYAPGDPGDLSQLGWQAMVIASARHAGLEVSPGVDQRIAKFIRSVAGGSSGGLAAYRPGEAPSRTMTAEALASRLLLRQRVSAGEIAEAQASLLSQLPGDGQDNLYYWYYASLALHQLQDDTWGRWNDAMKRRLVQTQQRDGSWPTTSVWGGYGGTVYTTAMSCLCLEVYYRHLTLTQPEGARVAERHASP